MSLEFTKNRLENADKRLIQFIDSNIVDWAEQVVLMPTRDNIIKLGLSQNAANAVTIEKTGLMKTKIRWEYRGPEDEPLHKWLENGFGKGGYDIVAKGKQNGGKDWLKYIDKSGKPIFRKKVRHPGFEGYKVIRNSYDQTKEQLKTRVIVETNNFMEIERL